MKFEFELDALDAEDFSDLFQFRRMRLLAAMLDNELSPLNYVRDNLAEYQRGYINSIKLLDDLQNRVYGCTAAYDTDLTQYIDRYGENEYDADGNFVRVMRVDTQSD